MNLLQRLGGAYQPTLTDLPTEGRRYTGMGCAILLTGAVAALAGTVFLHDFLYMPLWGALPLGLGWGAGIMGLDRWLLVSARRQRTWWLTALQGLPRVLLAALIGYVVAEPTVLRVFRTEVEREAHVLKKEKYKGDLAAIEAQFGDIATLKTRQGQLQSDLLPDTGAILPANPRYRQISRQIAERRTLLLTAQDQRQCGLAGRCPSTPASLRNLSGRIEVLRGQLVQRRVGLRQLRLALLAQEATSSAQKARTAENELKTVRGELSDRRAERRDARREARSDYKRRLGLMDRVEALHHLIGSRPGTGFYTWVLRLFIMAIDLVPVLFKILSLFGKPYAADEDEQIGSARGWSGSPTNGKTPRSSGATWSRRSTVPSSVTRASRSSRRSRTSASSLSARRSCRSASSPSR